MYVQNDQRVTGIILRYVCCPPPPPRPAYPLGLGQQGGGGSLEPLKRLNTPRGRVMAGSRPPGTERCVLRGALCSHSAGVLRCRVGMYEQTCTVHDRPASPLVSAEPCLTRMHPVAKLPILHILSRPSCLRTPWAVTAHVNQKTTCKECFVSHGMMPPPASMPLQDHASPA